MNKSIVYFQTKGMNPKYCEAGMFLCEDEDYIYYLDEPCKIHKNEVVIIPSSRVVINKKTRQNIVLKYAKSSI